MTAALNRGDVLPDPCPRCGSKLVVRQNRTHGNLFVGCFGYHDTTINCRFSRPLEDHEMGGAPAQSMQAPNRPTDIHPDVRPFVDDLEPEGDRDPFGPTLKEEIDRAENPLMKVAELMLPRHSKETQESLRALLAKAFASVARVVNEDYLTDADVSSQVSACLHRLTDEQRLWARDNHCGHSHPVIITKE